MLSPDPGRQQLRSPIFQFISGRQDFPSGPIHVLRPVPFPRRIRPLQLADDLIFLHGESPDPGRPDGMAMMDPEKSHRPHVPCANPRHQRISVLGIVASVLTRRGGFFQQRSLPSSNFRNCEKSGLPCNRVEPETIEVSQCQRLIPKPGHQPKVLHPDRNHLHHHSYHRHYTLDPTRPCHCDYQLHSSASSSTPYEPMGLHPTDGIAARRGLLTDLLTNVIRLIHHLQSSPRKAYNQIASILQSWSTLLEEGFSNATPWANAVYKLPSTL